jgi:hypothetical protein
MRDMDINVHERLSSKSTQIKVKKQLVVRKDIDINVVRKDIDINVHERHDIYIYILSYYKLFLYFNLCSFG